MFVPDGGFRGGLAWRQTERKQQQKTKIFKKGREKVEKGKGRSKKDTGDKGDERKSADAEISSDGQILREQRQVGRGEEDEEGERGGYWWDL